MSVYNTFAPVVLGRGRQATHAAVAQTISAGPAHRLTPARTHAAPDLRRGAITTSKGGQA